ncbi:Barstar (barnase inhibitor) [Pseudonocardia thermophila]|jgi:Barstar, RNAse (barnase) inhibitor|uniref:Barstar (Barnase inhibitor) n=1 Tax=Pseudonocardia thermophila TaxID=1848 RepID=A0A1M7A5K3_PSETH|nr:barstar family protein [Pseudonocardia thermophila]SHL38021.1 Barstar (barnase inhibitor) [Pseudonocardia thermophila]
MTTPGNGLVRVAMTANAIAAEAKLRGAIVAVVGPAERRVELLTQIGKALRFPGYYGRNLDALEECLTDLSWLPEGEVVLVWDGDEVLRRADPAGYAAVVEVLTAATEEMSRGPRPLHVVLPTASGSSTGTT